MFRNDAYVTAKAVALTATNKALEQAFVRERLEAVGVEIMPPERRTREYLAKILPGAVAKQVEIIRAGGLAVE